MSDFTCSDKVSYPTKRQAEAAAVQAEHFYGTKLKVYKCQQCGLWHLASA